MLKRGSLQKVWTFVLHLNNLIMLTIYSILRNICNLELLSNADLDFVKTKAKGTGLFSLDNTTKILKKFLQKRNLQVCQVYAKTKIFQFKSLITIILLLMLTRKPISREWKIFQLIVRRGYTVKYFFQTISWNTV